MECFGLELKGKFGGDKRGAAEWKVEVLMLECFEFELKGKFCGDKIGAEGWKLAVGILECFKFALKGKFGGDKRGAEDWKLEAVTVSLELEVFVLDSFCKEGGCLLVESLATKGTL